MFGVTMRNSCFREFSNVFNHRYCSRAFCDRLWKRINPSDSLFIIRGPLQVDIMSFKYQNVVECGLGFNRISFLPRAFHENIVFYLDIGTRVPRQTGVSLWTQWLPMPHNRPKKYFFFPRPAFSCSRYCRLQSKHFPSYLLVNCQLYNRSTSWDPEVTE